MGAFKRFRGYFRGLAALLSIVLMIWICGQLYAGGENVSGHINPSVVRLMMLVTKDFPKVMEEWIGSFVFTDKQLIKN